MKSIGTKELETERLILRRVRKEDAAEAFNNWTNDERVSRYVPWEPHGVVENTIQLFTLWEQQYENSDTYRWIVQIKETKELIGTIDVVKLDVVNKTAEIGYCYSCKSWGKGYGTESLKRVIDFLFNEVEVELIHAKHVAQNPASGKVMEKSGLKYEATLKKRYIDKVTGERDDLVVYSIMK